MHEKLAKYQWFNITKVVLISLRFVLFLIFLILSLVFMSTNSSGKVDRESNLGANFLTMILVILIFNWRVLISILINFLLLIAFLLTYLTICTTICGLTSAAILICIKRIVMSLFWKNLEVKFCYRCREIIYIFSLLISLAWIVGIIVIATLTLDYYNKNGFIYSTSAFVVYYLNILLIIAGMSIQVFRFLQARRINSKLRRIFDPDEIMSLKAKRFLIESQINDSICSNTASSCDDFDLIHRVKCHRNDPFLIESIKEVGFGEKNVNIIIGYHQTSIEAMKSIVKTKLKPSASGMLGQGIYFANNYGATEGKANNFGATICAKIDLQRMKMTERTDNKINAQDLLKQKFNSLYFIHPAETPRLDEFTIPDSSQILEYTVLVKDGPLKEYENKRH